MTNDEARMAKECRNPNVENRVLASPSSMALLFSPDGRENQVQFFCFLPKAACFVLDPIICGRQHAPPVLGFTRFLFARCDFQAEFLLGNGVVRLTVIRTDARRGPDDLTD